MKKLFLRIASVVAIVAAAVFTPSSVSAASAEKTLGFMGGYSSYNGGGFADIYFKYTFAPHLRVAPDLGYAFRSEGKSAFLANVDLQMPFQLGKGFEVYPLVGVTFNNWEYEHGGHASRGGFNFGGGIQIDLTSQISLDVKFKYSMMNDTGGCFLGMGIGYSF